MKTTDGPIDNDDSDGTCVAALYLVTLLAVLSFVLGLAVGYILWG